MAFPSWPDLDARPARAAAARAAGRPRACSGRRWRPAGAARRSCSTRGRRPPTAARASTTCSPGRSRTWSAATTRCRARRSPASRAGTPTACRSRSRSRRSSSSAGRRRSSGSAWRSSTPARARACSSTSPTGRRCPTGSATGWTTSIRTSPAATSTSRASGGCCSGCTSATCSTAGHRVLPYCPRCGTVLSSHELALGYEEVTTNSVYVTFPLRGRPVAPAAGLDHDAVDAAVQRGGRGAPRARVRRVPGGRPAAHPGHGPRGRAAEQQPPRARRPSPSSGAVRTFPGRELAGLRYLRPLEVVPLPDDRRVAAGRARATSSPRRTARAWCTWRRRSAPTTTRPGIEHGLALVRPVAADGTLLGTTWPEIEGRLVTARETNDLIIQRLKQDGRWHLTAAAHAHLSALLALLEPADLLRARQLVRAHVGGEGPDAGAQPRRSTGIRPRSAPGGSASGSRTTSTGRSRATGTGARRCRSGSATATRRTSR